MAEGIFEGREILTSRLHRLLGTLVNSVEIAGQNNLSSSHVVAETTMAGLLNRVYGWELVNANTIRQNYPGVDLIDTERNIAVQVTATRTTEKVRHTLEEAGKSGRIYKKLIVLILTNSKPTEGMYTCTVPTYSGPVTIWNIPDVFRDARELEPVKLAELTRFMEAEVGSIRERVKDLPHLELPPSSALQATGFVGRDPELAEIQSRFARGDRMVVLTGLGGMGKTELAAKYGRDYPGLVYFVRFDTSFRRTLANMSLGIRPKLTEEDLRLEEGILIKKVLTLLERSSSEDLLIIDNADSETGALADLMKEPGYKLIQALPLRLLVTTRSESPRAIRVARMPDDPLFEIFRNHGAALSEDEMRKLIRAVNGHTLTIDLIARTLNGKGWRKVTAEKMLTALRENNLKDQKYRKIATDYNQSTEQAQIYEHLSVVFDLSGMPAGSRTVMGYATLLPEGGMEGECFGMSLSEAEQDALDSLLEHGWLEMKDDLLTIHPVIRLVCRTELTPTDESCEAFLDRLWEQFDRTQYLPARYTQMVELFTIAHDRLGKHHGRWLNRAGILLNELDQHRKLHDLYHTRLAQLENSLAPNATELATAYNYYGISLEALGRYPAALNYAQKALAIQQVVLLEDCVELAYSYNNVGNVYGSLGNYQKSLKYEQIALDILKKSLPPEHLDLAKAFNNLGYTFGKLGNHHKALMYTQIALDLRRKMLPPEHPDLASSYNNVGSIYSDLGNHHRALEFHQTALARRQCRLPSKHPNLATSYDNVGSTYNELGSHHKALEFHQLALDIRRKALPPEHPHLALSYSNIAWTYHELGDLIRAAQYMRWAADIIEHSDLPKTHPDRIDFPKWATEFEKKAEMQRRILSQLPDWNSNPFPFGKK